MSVTASIVVHFGEGVDSGAFNLAMLDKELNVDASGNELTQFAPGDVVYFLVQHDPSLKIVRVAATDGTVAAQGIRTVTMQDQVDFVAAGESVDITALPSGAVTVGKWYGRQGAGMKITGRNVSVTSGTPAKADLDYKARMNGYKLVTPAVSLTEDETYPITVFIYFEAA